MDAVGRAQLRDVRSLDQIGIRPGGLLVAERTVPDLFAVEDPTRNPEMTKKTSTPT